MRSRRRLPRGQCHAPRRHPFVARRQHLVQLHPARRPGLHNPRRTREFARWLHRSHRSRCTAEHRNRCGGRPRRHPSRPAHRGAVAHRHGCDVAVGLRHRPECIVAAGTLIPEGKIIPPRSLVMGVPGKLIAPSPMKKWSAPGPLPHVILNWHAATRAASFPVPSAHWHERPRHRTRCRRLSET